MTDSIRQRSVCFVFPEKRSAKPEQTCVINPVHGEYNKRKQSTGWFSREKIISHSDAPWIHFLPLHQYIRTGNNGKAGRTNRDSLRTETIIRPVSRVNGC